MINKVASHFRIVSLLSVAHRGGGYSEPRSPLRPLKYKKNSANSAFSAVNRMATLYGEATELRFDGKTLGSLLELQHKPLPL